MSEQTNIDLLNQIEVIDHDSWDDVLLYAFCKNSEENKSILLKLGATESDINALSVEYDNTITLDLSQIGFRWAKWFQGDKWWSAKPYKCDWCDELVTEVSHPHMFDAYAGGKMCKGCWEHDRVVYKGSYDEDIGEFVPVKESESSEQ